MKKLLLSLLFMAAFALPAHAGLWVGPVFDYEWHSDVDFNDHNIVPALAVGIEAGALELRIQKYVDTRPAFVGDWVKRTPYRAEAVLKLRF